MSGQSSTARKQRNAMILARIDGLPRTPGRSLYDRLHVPPHVVRRRRALIAAIVIALCIGGYLAIGVWGILLGPLSVVAAIVTAVVAWRVAKDVVGGRWNDLGELRWQIEPSVRRAVIASTFRAEDRSLAALALAERTLLYWAVDQDRISYNQEELLRALLDIAAGRPTDVGGGWTIIPAEAPSDARDLWVGLSQNRLGFGMFSGGTIGGSKPAAADVNAACVAFVRSSANADARLRGALETLCEYWVPPRRYTARHRLAAAVRTFSSDCR